MWIQINMFWVNIIGSVITISPDNQSDINVLIFKTQKEQYSKICHLGNSTTMYMETNDNSYSINGESTPKNNH